VLAGGPGGVYSDKDQHLRDIADFLGWQLTVENQAALLHEEIHHLKWAA